MRPVTLPYSFTADTTGGTQPEDVFQTLSPEALRYLHLGIHIGKSHPHL